MSKKTDGRKLILISTIVYIIMSVTDKFIFEIPDPIYVLISIPLIFFIFRGLWLRKKEGDQ
jgi:hypothetical protein